MSENNPIKCRLFSYDGETETDLHVSINDLGNIEINAYVDYERTSIELSAANLKELIEQLSQASEEVINKIAGGNNG